MSRIKFRKGKQREFLKRVLESSNCPSLREINNRGFDVSYDCLKNYYSERRSLPEDFFDKLCKFSGIEKNQFNWRVVGDNFGQIKGGAKRRKKNKDV